MFSYFHFCFRNHEIAKKNSPYLPAKSKPQTFKIYIKVGRKENNEYFPLIFLSLQNTLDFAARKQLSVRRMSFHTIRNLTRLVELYSEEFFLFKKEAIAKAVTFIKQNSELFNALTMLNLKINPQQNETFPPLPL
uniref:Uncharacterized protein n=1 Tax=Micrurus lemniscatus lemniscatus TaxID=129467 RepID=A0A2D4IAJ7_MICLE